MMQAPSPAAASPFRLVDSAAYQGANPAQPNLKVKVTHSIEQYTAALGSSPLGAAAVSTAEAEEAHTSDHSSADCAANSLAGLAFNSSPATFNTGTMQVANGQVWPSGGAFGAAASGDAYRPLACSQGVPAQMVAGGGHRQPLTPTGQSPRAGEMLPAFASSDAGSEGNSKGGKRKRGGALRGPAVATAPQQQQQQQFQMPFSGSEDGQAAQFASLMGSPGFSGGGDDCMGALSMGSGSEAADGGYDEDPARAKERRERNRVAARKCRAKKVQMVRTMQDELKDLMCQNHEMKMQVVTWHRMFSREVKLREAMKKVLVATWGSHTAHATGYTANDVIIGLETGTLDINTIATLLQAHVSPAAASAAVAAAADLHAASTNPLHCGSVFTSSEAAAALADASAAAGYGADPEAGHQGMGMQLHGPLSGHISGPVAPGMLLPSPGGSLALPATPSVATAAAAASPFDALQPAPGSANHLPSSPSSNAQQTAAAAAAALAAAAAAGEGEMSEQSIHDSCMAAGSTCMGAGYHPSLTIRPLSAAGMAAAAGGPGSPHAAGGRRPPAAASPGPGPSAFANAAGGGGGAGFAMPPPQMTRATMGGSAGSAFSAVEAHALAGYAGPGMQGMAKAAASGVSGLSGASARRPTPSMSGITDPASVVTPQTGMPGADMGNCQLPMKASPQPNKPTGAMDRAQMGAHYNDNTAIAADAMTHGSAQAGPAITANSQASLPTAPSLFGGLPPLPSLSMSMERGLSLELLLAGAAGNGMDNASGSGSGAGGAFGNGLSSDAMRQASSNAFMLESMSSLGLLNMDSNALLARNDSGSLEWLLGLPAPGTAQQGATTAATVQQGGSTAGDGTAN